MTEAFTEESRASFKLWEKADVRKLHAVYKPVGILTPISSGL